MAQKVALEIQILRSRDTQRTIEEIARLELELDRLNKSLKEARRAGNETTYTRLKKDVSEVRGNISRLNVDLRQQKKDFEAVAFAPGSYQQLSRALVVAKREFQALSKEAREGIAGRDLLVKIQRLDRELKSIDKSTGVFTRNVGNYASAMRGFLPLLAAAGVGVGIQELVQGVRVAVETFAQFDQEIATLGAISGATGDELTALRDNAQRLGETTQFTAKQVAELQTNFARTGFNPDQIIKATEATVNLAIATQENVVTSSDVVGAAIKAFSLAASDAGRVTDVMTASFNSSRLALDKWAEAQKYAAPVAASLNVSIEASAAAMAALADAGLEGSNIGTGLRRILVDLGNENSKLSKFIGFSVKSTEDFTKAMEILADANLDSTKSFELVGRIGQTALLNLANRGRDVVRDGELVKGISTLTAEFEKAAGMAERTAKIVGDTFAQDVLKAKSAVEGLRINFVSLANDALRSAVQGFTSLVDTLNRWIKIPASERLREEQRGLNALVVELTQVNTSEERRLDIIAELQAKYPAFLKNVNIETASNEDLVKALEKANEEYTQRILLQKLSEEVDKRRQKLEARTEKVIDKQVALADILARAQKVLGDGYLTAEAALAQLEAQAERTYDAELKMSIPMNEQAGLADQLRVALGRLGGARARQEKAVEELGKAEEKQKTRLEVLKEQFPDLVEAIEAIEGATGKASGGLEVAGRNAEELRALLADLRDQIEEVPEGSPLYEELETQISEVEAALRKMGAGVGDTGAKVEKFTAGSLKALRKELSDLQSKLEDTPASSAKYVEVLGKIRNAEKALNEELRKRELFEFNAADFAGDPAEVEQNIKALERAMAMAADIQRQRAGDPSFFDVDKNLEALKVIEERALISLQKQFRAGKISEEEFAEEKKAIAQRSELEALDVRLRGYEVGSAEYLALVREKADKELEIEKENADKIAQAREEMQRRLVDYAFQAADAVAGALSQIEANRLSADLDARIEAIDAEYAAKLEAAEGNAALTAQLEDEQEQKRLALEREAAVRRKELAKKEALIQGALGVIKTIATLGFGNPLLIAALAAQAVTTAAQLAVIDSQQFARGGLVKGKSHEEGGEKFVVRNTGQRVELEGGEAVINRRSMASKEVLSVTGTPAQIASQINAYKGYGDAFTTLSGLAKMVKLKGGGLVLDAGGVVPRSVQLINPNGGGAGEAAEIRVEMSDDQIERIAQVLASRTAKETGQSVELALVNANRATERRKFVTNKTGIK